MKTIGTIFLLLWLVFYTSAQFAINPATGLPIGKKGEIIYTNELDKISADADIIFKGQVISSTRITNTAFQVSDIYVHATKLKIISVLKGETSTNQIVFQHYYEWSPGGHGWGGGSPPEPCKLQPGQSYLIFAAKMDNPGYYFFPDSTTNQPNEFRQLTENRNSIFHTLDARPLTGLSISNALWLELNLLLKDKSPTNQLYAIQHLNLMSKSCLASWGHKDYFDRKAVLEAVSSFVNSPDDRVAVYTIGCFQLGGNAGTFVTDQGGWIPVLRGFSEIQTECVAQVSSYATNLVNIANKSPSVSRRIASIAAFSGTKFPIVSNSLPSWLDDASEKVRAQAVLLLPDFPGEWSEQLLRKQDMDSSPKIRSIVATAIGNEQMESLIPVLVKQFSEPLGPTNPIPPLTLEDLQSGGQLLDENVGDVHTSAGYALLKFDVNQVGDILRTNLNDIGFRMQFLCKLAENDPEPWLTNLVGELKTRRERIWKEVEAGVNEPKTNYYRARMTLSGAYFTCWNMIYHHLANLPDSAFAGGKLDWALDELEESGCADSNRPIEVYGLYRSKGLNDRAARFRRQNGKYDSGYDLSSFFDRADLEKSKEQK